MLSPRTRPTVIGVVGCCCALLGFLSWIGYGKFATKGIYAVISRQSEVAHHMASYVGGFHMAQLVLGVLSIGLGWKASAMGEDSTLARRLGALAVCSGVAVLALLLFLV